MSCIAYIGQLLRIGLLVDVKGLEMDELVHQVVTCSFSAVHLFQESVNIRRLIFTPPINL